MDAVVGMGRNKLGKKVTANTEAPVFASTSDSQCAYIRCHLFAKCQDGLCRCYSGYEEDRMGQCVPTQACRKATRACGCNSVCVGLAGHLSCMCKNGYEKIVGSLRCFDINECQREEFQCPKSAYCFNVSGGYRCLCKAGYTASFTEDGLVCAPGMISDAGNTLSNYTQSSVKIWEARSFVTSFRMFKCFHFFVLLLWRTNTEEMFFVRFWHIILLNKASFKMRFLDLRNLHIWLWHCSSLVYPKLTALATYCTPLFFRWLLFHSLSHHEHDFYLWSQCWPSITAL